MRTFRRTRSLFAPETVQTSALDCGPAALRSLLAGFGIAVNYARLQEACQIDVDGSSINTIEQLARTLGLDARQVMLPVDHLLLHSTRMLPALIVVHREGILHFLVIWRKHGRLVQLMDPAKGRRWLTEEALRSEIYIHRHRVQAAAWRHWAGSEEFLNALDERIGALEIADGVRDRLRLEALADSTWRTLGALDASTRMVTELCHAGAISRGREAGGLIHTLVTRSGREENPHALVPPAYWSVVADTPQGDTPHLVLQGAVLLRVRERAPAEAPTSPGETPVQVRPEMPETLARALTQPMARPLADVWRRIRIDGRLAPGLLVAALVLAGGAAVAEMLMLRGALDLHLMLTLREHRIIGTLMLLAFVGALLVFDAAIAAGMLRIGRRFETRLRAALLDKLPRIGDRYFHSRLVSDMADRAHALYLLRGVPDLGARFTRTSTQLLVTTVGLVWLAPSAAWLAVLAAVLALALPLATQRLLAERELRQRSHSAGLARSYLDSLLGLVAARTHGAERALRQRHEFGLVEWGRSSLHLLRGCVVVEGLQMLTGSILAVLLVVDFVNRGGQPGAVLLLVYWALGLPLLGRDIAATVRQFPAYRNVFARILELLNAPEEAPRQTTSQSASREPAVAVDFKDVDVRVAGQTILQNLDVTIGAGEHVAVVGRSGAGKSTLLGLLLGWTQPAAGCLAVDGVPLDAEGLRRLRGRTAWIDPAVHLWNRALFDNLRYGSPGAVPSRVGSAVDAADIAGILDKLPDGLQSPLGEGGGLTSGGEGQRVRLGRALVRSNVGLVLLDEPFRGLDRQQRTDLLARARETWRDATLICVTHDIADTLRFDRVLVMEGGHLVEDGAPAVLAQTPNSAYAALLSAEWTVKSTLLSGGQWRRWRLEDHAIVERPPRMETRPDAGAIETPEENSWTTVQSLRGR